MRAYTLTRVFVSSISAAAAYKSFLFRDALIFLQCGAIRTEGSISRSVVTADGVLLCVYREIFCVCVCLLACNKHKIQLTTIMNCTVCVALGKIMIIRFTVIDLAVFRHTQLTLIMHLTVRI